LENHWLELRWVMLRVVAKKGGGERCFATVGLPFIRDEDEGHYGVMRQDDRSPVTMWSGCSSGRTLGGAKALCRPAARWRQNLNRLLKPTYPHYISWHGPDSLIQSFFYLFKLALVCKLQSPIFQSSTIYQTLKVGSLNYKEQLSFWE
jgi:hypothetical protein